MSTAAKRQNQFDVIVIGGGPSGSTAANLLVQGGLSVLVLEKDHFPRFHIGESLLPCDLPIFARLGVSLEGKPYLYKGGAEFIDERTGDYAEYLFCDGLPGTPPHAYQVERAQFDHLLLERSKAVGAVVNDGVRVTDVVPDALSAVYTFFAPEHAHRSLGVYAILRQVRRACEEDRQHLYLGFWLDGHPRMAYKRGYRPLEFLDGAQWRPVPA